MHKSRRKPWLCIRMVFAYFLAATCSADTNVYIKWQNGVVMTPDTPKSITMPGAIMSVTVHGSISRTNANSHAIAPGDYLSVITSLQSCSSTMDMRSGALFGLGMIPLDSQYSAVIPLSLVPVNKYTLCVCPNSSTQVISEALICRDQAGLDTGLEVHRFFLENSKCHAFIAASFCARSRFRTPSYHFASTPMRAPSQSSRSRSSI
jgi:hypothetical protein